MATIVTASGLVHGGVFVGENTLATLQGLVGGYIQMVANGVKIGDETFVGFVCNEEGKLQGLPVNVNATKMWRHNGGDVLCGDVVFLKKGELK